MEGSAAGLSYGEQMGELLPMDDVDENLAKFNMQTMLLLDEISLTASVQPAWTDNTSVLLSTEKQVF